MIFFTVIFSKFCKKFRSRHQKCSTKKHVKVAGLKVYNFIKMRLQNRCFPVNIAKLLRTPILKNICE